MGFWDCVKELIDSELTERLRIYAGAEYLGRQGNKPWLRYAALDCADAADEIERLTSELAKSERKFEIKSAHSEMWQPCSGHRGKIDTRRDGCPWCRAEAAEARVRELEAQLQCTRDEVMKMAGAANLLKGDTP